VIVSRPLSRPGLERELIAVIKPPHQLSYLAQTRWSAALPQLAQYFIIETLQNQNAFQSVTPDTRYARNNYRLDVHIHAFQAEYAKDDTTPDVYLKMAFTLTNLASRVPIASFTEDVRVPAAENRISAMMAGFQTALEHISLSASARIYDILSQQVDGRGGTGGSTTR
jgi:ABC-type uncharacterized transport system auxiliary subunit